MKKNVALVLVLLGAPALAQDLTLYNRALSQFNAGQLDEAARGFYELTESSTDPEIRAKSEYYLAQSLARKDLPFSAFIYYAGIVTAGQKHPFYLKAVEGLVNVQDVLDDQYLIPSTLNREYKDAWATLPLEVLARINYLIGAIAHRQSRFDEARDFLQAVPRETSIYPKAQYLLGIVYVDPRHPGGAKAGEAIRAFQEVLSLRGAHYDDLTETQQLATLGLGRTWYGMGEYAKAVQAYESIPRFTKYWDEALFENGFARFQNDDYGGALGSLQALHAPQFSAFQPESWILKATVYYFSCLYEESKGALRAFDELYLPVQEKLRALLQSQSGEKDVGYYYRLVATDDTRELPRPVLLWVRSNERMLGLFAILRQIEKEKGVINGSAAWKGSPMGPALTNYLDQNRNTLTQVAGTLARNRLQEAMQNIKTFSDAAEIIRFETTKAEKELFETGADQSRVLQAQNLYRPAMPAENWNYWKFQGEFWRDEIGYYQYTLKNGCPSRPGQ
jgi:hypothetical protein